jgi:hypothetical protein
VTWLHGQDDRADQVGELARKWKADATHGNLSSPAGIGRHIEAAWDDTTTWMEVLRIAADEHNAAKAGQLRSVTSHDETTGDPPPWAAAILDRLASVEGHVTLTNAALAYLLPDEALNDLMSQVTALEPADFGELYALADFTDEGEAADG